MNTSPSNTPTDGTMSAEGDKKLEESSLGNPCYLTQNSLSSKATTTDDPHQPIPNFYTILGVKPTCSHAEIDAAYRVLAAANHPSRNPSDPNQKQTQRRFNEISHAYSVLSDDARRYYYDQLTQHHFTKDDALRNFEAFFKDFDKTPDEQQFFEKYCPKRKPNYY